MRSRSFQYKEIKRFSLIYTDPEGGHFQLLFRLESGKSLSKTEKVTKMVFGPRIYWVLLPLGRGIKVGWKQGKQKEMLGYTSRPGVTKHQYHRDLPSSFRVSTFGTGNHRRDCTLVMEGSRRGSKKSEELLIWVGTRIKSVIWVNQKDRFFGVWVWTGPSEDPNWGNGPLRSKVKVGDSLLKLNKEHIWLWRVWFRSHPYWNPFEDFIFLVFLEQFGAPRGGALL